ncbi:MAG: Trk system potassium transporter TrkA [Bdellovibrionales bacterium]|nr:Trk system potassium transporter TrkA [Bdellovibrionales bacterium]
MKFIILGAGDVGMTLAAQLVKENHDVVIIERDDVVGNAASLQLDVQVLSGNGCSPEVLARAGLNTADYFIAVADNDPVNIAACLVAKLLNPIAKRIARIRQLSLIHKDISPEHLSEYFDLIINPTQAAVDYLVRIFRVVGARDVIDFCDGKLQVIALDVKPHSRFVGKKLAHLADLQNQLKTLVIAIVRDGELIVPHGNSALQREDTIYCITPPENIASLFELAGNTHAPGEVAIVWGAGTLGRMLAHRLEAQGTRVKLIIDETKVSPDIVDDFHNTLVLSGDGKDKNLLIEENISEVDAFFAVTSDHEDNILGALLAKKLGARTSMALVNKATYLPLVHAIGVDVVASSRAAAASAIFSHIHADSLVSEFSLRHLGAGFVEIPVKSKAPICGKTIAEIRAPQGTIFAAITRGNEVILPRGNTEIHPDDRVVVFLTQGEHSKLEKLFGKKFEFIM